MLTQIYVAKWRHYASVGYLIDPCEAQQWFLKCNLRYYELNFISTTCDVSLRWDEYRQTSNISRTLVGNKIVDRSDVVGAAPVGAAPTTSSFSAKHMASMDWAKTTARRDEKHLSFGIWCGLY